MKLPWAYAYKQCLLVKVSIQDKLLCDSEHISTSQGQSALSNRASITALWSMVNETRKAKAGFPCYL